MNTLTQQLKDFREKERQHVEGLLKIMHSFLSKHAHLFPETHETVNIYWTGFSENSSCYFSGFESRTGSLKATFEKALSKEDKEFVQKWLDEAVRIRLLSWSDIIGLRSQKVVFKMNRCIVVNSELEDFEIKYLNLSNR